MTDNQQESKYKVVAIIGPSGAGKDTIMNETCEKYGSLFHRIVSITTRPKRDCEEEGHDYRFISKEDFLMQEKMGGFLETTEFNGWCYGTPIDALRKDAINIGVFNIDGVERLSLDEHIDVFVVMVQTPLKERLLRSLTREENPNCLEICRRALADEEDFLSLPIKVDMIFYNPDDNFCLNLMDYPLWRERFVNNFNLLFNPPKIPGNNQLNDSVPF